MSKPAISQKRFLLVFFFMWAIVLWIGFAQGPSSLFSLLSRANELRGPFGVFGVFGVFGGISFVFQLMFIGMLAYVYDPSQNIGKAYTSSLAAIVLILCISYISTGTILGIENVSLYEPLFMTFLFLNTLVLYVRSKPSKFGANGK